jgi:Transposase DDE domain group 1
MDAGFGTDANLAYLLPYDYQVLVKGFSAGRAAAHARCISRWTEIRADDTWAAWSAKPLQLSRPSRTVVLKQRTPTRERHALLLTTLLELELSEIVSLYDDRGQMEVEIQSDKMGLLIARRRKHSFAAQELLILLNDWVHNLLAVLHTTIFQASPFATFGPKRLIRDVLSIPGAATFEEGQLKTVKLSAQHPYADAMVMCLSRLLTDPHIACE